MMVGLKQSPLGCPLPNIPSAPKLYYEDLHLPFLKVLLREIFRLEFLVREFGSKSSGELVRNKEAGNSYAMDIANPK